MVIETTKRGRAKASHTQRQYPRHHDPTAIVASDFPFRIDEKRRRITYFNQRLDLSPYEYELLTVLIGNPGRVYTREQFTEMVWDDPSMILDRTVDTHIKNLRSKMNQIRADIKPIITRRGIGHSLREPW